MSDVSIESKTDTTRNRLNWAITTLRAMLYGDKPCIDIGNPEQSWLFDQMTRMYRAGFLCEEPKCYVTLPGEDLNAVIDEDHGTTLRQLKGVTIREPLPKILTTEEKYLNLTVEEDGIHNFKLFGVDEAYRYHRDSFGMLNDADAFVLSRGGLMELYQYLRFLKAGVDGVALNGDKRFVVQNSDSFWAPLLAAFGPEIGQLGHTITNSRHETAAALKAQLGARSAYPARKGDIPPVAQPGAHIYVVTGTGKKVQEYRKVFNRRGTDISVKWFHEAFAKPLGAEEFSYSYVGNLVEKYRNLYEHLRDNIGPARFRKELAAKGSDINTALALLDDSGFETAAGLTRGPEFAHAAYRLNNYRDYGPGPELKNIMNAMQNQTFEGKRGTRAMVRRMFAAAERLEDERREAGYEEPAVSLNVRDRVTTMLFSFKDMIAAIEAGKDWRTAFDEMPIRFYQATTDSQLINAPRPDHAAVDTKYFLVPKEDPEKRTQAENPHFITLHSYTAQVVKAIARTAGFREIEDPDASLTGKFAKATGEAWRLGTQHSLHKGRRSTGLSKTVTRKLSGLYRFMAGNGGMHDLSLPRDHKIKRGDGSKFVMRTPLDNFYDFTRKSEGFLLTPDSRNLEGDQSFWERSFAFFSLIVGKQIKDKTVSAKPFFVMDCPTWRPLMNVFNHYAAGLIPEMPEHIFSGILRPDDPWLADKMNEPFSEYEPDQVPEHVFLEDGDKHTGEKFQVTIYCSASTTDGDMKAYARDFGFDLAAFGYDLKNGGGTGPDGLMFETSQGAKLFNGQFRPYLARRGHNDDVVPRAHVSSIQCQDTKEEEGLLTDVDYWAVYPTIYQRMHELQNCDAEVVLPGGAGTIQEIIASAIMRKNGLYPVENRPLIIVNESGNYDPFLKLIPKQDFKRLNIQVVDTKDEAFALLHEARTARGMQPTLPYTADEYARLKHAFTTRRSSSPTAPAFAA